MDCLAEASHFTLPDDEEMKPIAVCATITYHTDNLAVPHRGGHMQHPATSRVLGILGLLVCCLAAPLPSPAKDYLTINSEPPGATVELDGVLLGKTPYIVEIPGGYLHGTKSVFVKILRHQVHLKLTLDGYLPKEMDLASGPTPWVALNGSGCRDRRE